MIFEHVDPYFAAAAGAAGVALLVAAFVLRDAWLDLAAVRKAGIGNGRLKIAQTEIRFEAARTGVVALLALSAATAAILAGKSPEPLTVLQLTPRISLTAALAVIALDAVAALRYRSWLRETFHPDHPAAATVAGDDLEEDDDAV